MNQTGLAQKFGAVVSHVRIAAKQDDIKAVRIAAGDADLLLGCDLAVAASNDALIRVNAERSFAVVNEAEMPTAEFVFNGDAIFPATAMRASIAAEVGSDKSGDSRVTFIDATAHAHGLLGDNVGANVFLLGFAWQRGLVPVSMEALFRAIELNGQAVEFNQRAFMWGRQAAVNPDATRDLAGIPALPWQPLQKLDEIVADRKHRLTEYQNASYAQHYVDWIHHVRAAERDMRPADAEPLLTKAVARSLYKLMAYKDEYEVARLYCDGEFQRSLQQEFSGDYQLQFNLAPPLMNWLSAAGKRPRKYAFGGWMMGAFKVLAKAKIVRGTALDPFQFSADRKLERALIPCYESTLERLLLGLAPHNYRIAVAIAELPQQIRGFGPIKAEAVEKVRQRERELFTEFERGPEVQVVKIFPRAA